MTKPLQATALALVVFFGGRGSAWARYHDYNEWGQVYNAQALFGAVKYDEFTVTDDSGVGDTRDIDLSSFPQLGGAWTTLPLGNRVQCGLEASLLLGYRFDKVNYISLGGGVAEISISTSMWMFDLAGGAYANIYLDPKRRVRVYGAAGPLMLYAEYRSERTETDADRDTTYNSSVSSFGTGVYARTGIEFRIHQLGMIGFGARGTWGSIDFTGATRRQDLLGIAGFATYTIGF